MSTVPEPVNTEIPQSCDYHRQFNVMFNAEQFSPKRYWWGPKSQEMEEEGELYTYKSYTVATHTHTHTHTHKKIGTFIFP